MVADLQENIPESVQELQERARGQVRLNFLGRLGQPKVRCPPAFQVRPDPPSKFLWRPNVSGQEVARGVRCPEIGVASHKPKWQVREVTAGHLVVVPVPGATDLRAKKVSEKEERASDRSID
jgi:hypothetical protein